jgi:hypothetical protein
MLSRAWTAANEPAEAESRMSGGEQRFVGSLEMVNKGRKPG